MRHSLTATGNGGVSGRSLNGGGGIGVSVSNAGSGAGGGGAVTYLRLGPGATLTQLAAGVLGTAGSQSQGSFQRQQGKSGGGGSGNGNGNHVLFQRSQNNVVQIRRIVTKQPQQLQKLVGDFELSSSESSERAEERNKSQEDGRVGNGNGGRKLSKEDDKGDACLAEDDSMGEGAEVDVSIVDRGEGVEDDDEDLLMDRDEDDGGITEEDDRGGHGHRSAMELNGDKVDSEFLRHVIETQILNRHTARIKDWDGTKGHMCQSCHETFLSENGLEIHRNRRIHHILFFCRYCKRDISFFNKCRLLQHLRNHRVTPTVAGLQNCTMIRLLPESEYLHFKYEDCTSSSDEEQGGSGGGGSGSSNPHKRPKPSKFRRVARSSLSGNGLDSPDQSPPPSITRQIVAPPQQLSSTLKDAPSPPPQSTKPVISNSTSNTIGTIKYASGNVNGNTGPTGQQRSDQVTVIKSTGNTTSVILSSPAMKSESPSPPILTKEPSASNSAENPQIRIRNLSQITVSVNEDDDEEMDDEIKRESGESCAGAESNSQPLPRIVKISSLTAAPATSTTVSAPVNSTSQPTPQTQMAAVAKKKVTCQKCDRIFSSSREFFKHLEEQEALGLSSRSLHRCPTDDIPSWSQCQYVFHTKVFHEKSVPFMCPGCGDESPDYNTLMEHVTNNCFYSSLRVHYMCAAADQKCQLANKKSVKTEPQMIDHLKKEHSRSVLQCLQCTQGFATENWLLKHLADAHKVTVDESSGETGEMARKALVNTSTRPLIQCLICNILFPNSPTYLQHVYLNFHMHILHAKILECQSCFAVFEKTEDFMKHRQQSEQCQKLDPFEMNISTTAPDHTNPSGGQSTKVAVSSAPTSPPQIRIISNSSVSGSSTVIKTEQQQPKTSQQLIVQNVTTSVRSHIAGSGSVISMSNSSSSHKPPTIVVSSQQLRSQKPQPSMPLPKATNSNQTTIQRNTSHMNLLPSCPPKRPPQKIPNTTTTKKNFFDDLQSCQFCDRLVVFCSLRKHEDQCCGLSTVAPGFCLTCRQNFGDSKTLARHGIVHMEDGIPICLFCNNRHIRPTHPKSLEPSSQENIYALKKHLYSNHTSKAVQFPYKCPLCDKICSDKRATEFHIKDHQFNYKVDEPDPSPLPTSPEELQQLVRVRKKGMDQRRKLGKITHVFYCPVCKNREFSQEAGLARHLQLVHQKNPNALDLTLLKKVSTARRFVLKAAANTPAPSASPQRPQLRSISSTSSDSKTRPNNNPTLASRATRSSNGISSSSSSTTPSFTSRFSSGLVLRRRVVTSATTATVPGRKPAAVSPQRQAPTTSRLRSGDSNTTQREYRLPSNFLRSAAASKSVRNKDGTFSCLKCPEFSCKTENAFCEHIKWKHVWSETELQKLQYGNKEGLEERSEYWCPECNTVFVAKPSLVRHLKFAHDYIINVSDYMQKIGYDGKKPLKPNQCEVCYYQCAEDRELQQHIRTHGMAFLRLRQQRQMSMAKS